MRVRWTAAAEEQLDTIYAFIALDSRQYAKQTIDRLTKRSQQIGRFPMSGRIVPEYDSESIREVVEDSYRLIYRVMADGIDVLAVIHGAMELRNLTDQE